MAHPIPELDDQNVRTYWELYRRFSKQRKVIDDPSQEPPPGCYDTITDLVGDMLELLKGQYNVIDGLLVQHGVQCSKRRYLEGGELGITVDSLQMSQELMIGYERFAARYRDLPPHPTLAGANEEAAILLDRMVLCLGGQTAIVNNTLDRWRWVNARMTGRGFG